MVSKEMPVGYNGLHRDIELSSYKGQQQNEISVKVIVWAVIAGMAFSSILAVLIWCIPGLSASAKASPPWILLSSALVAPVLLYLWIRRDKHRQVEQWLKNRELNQGDLERKRKEREASDGDSRIRHERLEATFRKGMAGLEAEFGPGRWVAVRELENLAFEDPSRAPMIYQSLAQLAGGDGLASLIQKDANKACSRIKQMIESTD